MFKHIVGWFVKNDKLVAFGLGNITGSGITILSPKLYKLGKYWLTGKRK